MINSTSFHIFRWSLKRSLMRNLDTTVWFCHVGVRRGEATMLESWYESVFSVLSEASQP